MSYVRTGLAAVLAMAAPPAFAETLPVAGSVPAARANVNDLFRIAVDRFEGEDGAELTQAVEAALGSARFAGRPYFRMIAIETGAPFDAIVSGTVRTSISENRVTENRKRCVEHDPRDKKKCLKEVDVDIRCQRRVVTVSTTVRLAAASDGAIRYSRPLSSRDEQVFCPDRDGGRTIDDFVTDALRQQVGSIRRDIVPDEYRTDVRVDENRKGMPKAAQEGFKAAIRQTKSDPLGACASWQAMAREAAPTGALAYNLGLCAEMDGDLRAATDWYGQAQRLGTRGRLVTEALERVAATRRAEADWSVRQQSMVDGAL
ncbi:MAG: hypothetical protein U0S50_07105 [Sphingopyxis sp.]|uniref:hypothetical protein n=1 Tax=Sphingopyxis sp. TaxID=1908224 RepID=UPI002ABC1FB9|nr:hypothetical protein [Sphingopyxis sp.]MDZ3831568.1 hypothetical protein [Sphingopyxis sp.]